MVKHPDIIDGMGYDEDAVGAKSWSIQRANLGRLADQGVRRLLSNTARYTDEQRMQILAEQYSKYQDGGAESVLNLVTNRSLLSFLAAPETQQMAHRDFLQAARQYVLTRWPIERRERCFTSLQRLASTAEYPSSQDDRDAACRLDAHTLQYVKADVKQHHVHLGPVVRRLISMPYDAAESDGAPAPLAINSILAETGYAPKQAIERGYLPPIQTALVIDFGRLLAELPTAPER